MRGFPIGKIESNFLDVCDCSVSELSSYGGKGMARSFMHAAKLEELMR